MLLYTVSDVLYRQALKAPIISAAHVFEEVEVFQLNAKQDLLGLSPGLRHFIADSVLELIPWKFSPLEAQSDRFSQRRMQSLRFYLESTNREEAFQLGIIIDVLAVH